MNTRQPAGLEVERHAADPIPESERRGRAASLFTLWFSTNMQLTPVVTGALAVGLGLNLASAVWAIVLGTLVGTVFMAYHAAQGPRLGVPQMIQTRAQFGYFGALLPLVLVLVIYLGYFALTGVLGAQAFTAWSGGPVTLGLVLVAGVCIVLAMYGYHWIHRFERWVSLVLAAAFLYVTVRLLTRYSLPDALHHGGGRFTAGTFLLATSIVASYVITWAPYVSDYSRYLPAGTSTAATFGYTYLGTALSTLWMELLGAAAAAVAATAFNANPAAFIANLGGAGLAGVLFAVIIIGVIATNVMNLYSAYMTATTSLDWWLSRLEQRRKPVRLVSIAILGGCGIVLGVLAEGNLYNSLSNFLLLLLYGIIPWTAINLMDFYVIRRGQYDVAAMYDITGRYGWVHWRALAVYFVAGCAEIPFMNTTLYQGPAARAMGGGDIAWLVGLVVAAGLYFVAAPRQPLASPQEKK